MRYWASNSNPFSGVRLKVSFSTASLNMKWGLKDEEDEYKHLLKKISDVKSNKMMKEMSVKGIEWMAESDMQMKIARAKL